jgi:2-C-methyl-D-erythritol 2,4-cyclodiphosphate synthase
MSEIRIGIGYDQHRLVYGRRLFIGGIEIPYHMGLLGHSDGDVLLHAISDAILGAAGMGDIGGLFPDSDPLTEGIGSSSILGRVVELVLNAGWVVKNVDSVVVAERPSLSPYILSMRRTISGIIGIGEGEVSIKPKRPEGVGSLGRGEGIAAYAVVLLERKD